MEQFVHALASRPFRALASATLTITMFTGDSILIFGLPRTTSFVNSTIHVCRVSARLTGTTSSLKLRVHAIQDDTGNGASKTLRRVKPTTSFQGTRTEKRRRFLTHLSAGEISGFCVIAQPRLTTEWLRLDHLTKLAYPLG